MCVLQLHVALKVQNLNLSILNFLPRFTDIFYKFPSSGLMQQPWSFAVPGGKAVTSLMAASIQQKTKGAANQQQGNKQKKPMQQQQQQQGAKNQGKKKWDTKPTPTAAELDAELDAYLREMNK